MSASSAEEAHQEWTRSCARAVQGCSLAVGSAAGFCCSPCPPPPLEPQGEGGGDFIKLYTNDCYDTNRAESESREVVEEFERLLRLKEVLQELRAGYTMFYSAATTLGEKTVADREVIEGPQAASSTFLC